VRNLFAIGDHFCQNVVDIPGREFMVNRTLLWLLLLVLSIAGWRGLAAERAPDHAADAKREAISGARQLQGTLSCAASLCHGGSIVGQPRGEAATWRALDPHAGAYDALLSKQSQAIAKHLWGNNQAAHEAGRCLKCHVHPQFENATPNFRKEDGVGCESCHGAAQDWKEMHFRSRWKDTPWTEKESLGFSDTKHLAGRAAVCVTCHVGAPGMEVDHDLIAAGHPALRFEFATYFANLPPHWDVARDKKANSSADCKDFEGRAWLLGQLVTSAQALDLLAHNAADLGSKRWPELAQLDCFACHHDLQATSWRQSSDHLQKRRPGELLLNPWYFAMLPEIMSIAPGALEYSPLKATDVFGEKGRLNLAGHAKSLAQTMRKLAIQPPPLASPGSCSALPVIKSIRAGQVRDRSWDEATQRYLALLALRQMQADNAQPNDAELKESIESLRREVTFGGGMASPAQWSPRK
jgi:hypothetical protein